MQLFKTLLILLIITLSIHAETIQGKVIGVMDGDTVKVLVKKKQYKIRLYGIDAPEKNQAFGTKTKKALSKKIFGKNVKVKITDIDKYGRSIGTIFYMNRNINLEMVQEGFAWWYQKYSNDVKLAKAEKQARKNKLGIWSHKTQIPPWEFRHGKKRNNKSSNKKVNMDASYFASARSKVYHLKGCSSIPTIAEYNLVSFDTEEEVLNSGRRLCKKCKKCKKNLE